MKNIRILLLSALALTANISASAYNFSATYNGTTIYYNITNSANKTVSVTYKDTEYNCYSGKVTIPSSVTNNSITYSVTGIYKLAFNKCSNLTSISLPESITSMGESVFNECTSLTSVTLPKNIKSIPNWTFGKCTALTNVSIPSSVTSIGDNAFNGCTCEELTHWKRL